MKRYLAYKLNSGKNNKIVYFLKNGIQYMMPKSFYRFRLKSQIDRFYQKAKSNPMLLDRLNYYNKLASVHIDRSQEGMLQLKDHRYTKKYPSVYFFDTYQYTKWFNPSFLWAFLYGDITWIPQIPTIVKSRPIVGDNSYAVLMKLDKIRHFIFLNDTTPFTQKKNIAIFRGKVDDKAIRRSFMEKFFGNPRFDLGNVSKRRNCPSEWMTEKKTLREHLDYKFIMALEGNDVASNLKWIMASNSLAVMPKPNYETWFMEGKLIPNVHYVEVKEDFSDLEDKMDFYIKHPEEAQKIIDQANLYTKQFQNKEDEELLSIMVLYKYFRQTGQLK